MPGLWSSFRSLRKLLRKYNLIHIFAVTNTNTPGARTNSYREKAI